MDKIKYEQLMGWVIKNVDKKAYNLQNLGYSIQELDLHHVINNNDEFIAFVKDLEKRTHTSIINRKKSIAESGKRNVLIGFWENHYINLNKWELEFMRNVKSLKKYTDKQEYHILKILNKIDKRYAVAFAKA